MVAFPLVVTIFFGRFVFELLDRWFRPISRHLFGFPVPGVGLLLFLLGLYLLGLLATNVFGSRLLNLFERVISRLPAVGPIYQGARKITEAFQLRGSNRFRRVVLVPFPGPGLQSVGFVTQERPRWAAAAKSRCWCSSPPPPTRPPGSWSWCRLATWSPSTCRSRRGSRWSSPAASSSPTLTPSPRRRSWGFRDDEGRGGTPARARLSAQSSRQLAVASAKNSLTSMRVSRSLLGGADR